MELAKMSTMSNSPNNTRLRLYGARNRGGVGRSSFFVVLATMVVVVVVVVVVVGKLYCLAGWLVGWFACLLFLDL